jgi:RsiW-degrading membrane proteinase PrsW (M82 family)
MKMVMIYLAILPAAVLMYFIYKADKVEKEPVELLVKIFLYGVVTTISAVILELLGDDILGFFLYEDSLPFIFLENFFVVALAEELGKYVVVKKVAWKHPAFNYTFDAVVYAVFASLGFAVLENILYLTDASITTAVMRGVLAVPGHAIDAVFMGSYFGAAKRCEALGDKNGMKTNLQKALIVPVGIHGFYDFCLSVSDYYPIAILVFFVFEIGITIYAIRKVKKLSASDTALFPTGYYPGATIAAQMYNQRAMGFEPMPVQPAMNFDPMTGQPLQPVMQPVQPLQPAMNFDPMTGKPLHPIEQPVQPVMQPAMNFDPMTGKPLQPVQPVVQPAMNFDPMTGKPLQPVQPVVQPAMNFDPMTGKPLHPVEQPVQSVVQPSTPADNDAPAEPKEFVPVTPIQYDPVTGQPVVLPE